MENELGLPVELNKKELKLLKRSLPSMLEEHRRIQRKFRPRKNSGVRGMPKCTHNRLRRLEEMIEYKGELIAELSRKRMLLQQKSRRNSLIRRYTEKVIHIESRFHLYHLY